MENRPPRRVYLSEQYLCCSASQHISIRFLDKDEVVVMVTYRAWNEKIGASQATSMSHDSNAKLPAMLFHDPCILFAERT